MFAGTTGLLVGCIGQNSNSAATATTTPKNVIFFLGDGMGITTLTAARIYKVGETGDLTIDTLPETAFVKTYSNDAQVTDSAPSMAAYMTGVKTNNEVISMTPDTVATAPTADPTTGVANAVNNCAASNGTNVKTLLELAKASGRGTGAITTTELTHATPAATYSHICNRNAQFAIAAQAVPDGAGYNTWLTRGTDKGVDVLMGGGLNHFTPYAAGTNPKGRADGRDLTAELTALGYTVGKTRADMLAAPNDKKFIGLYSKTSHLEYDLDRQAQVAAGTGNGVTQPSLSEMTTKAMDILSSNPNGYFLMVEGGRIDHALHSTNAKRALQDTVAFDDAIKAAIDKAKLTDPTLANTLIVVTADHDHTLVLNGYAQRTGATTATNPGVLGLVKNYVTGLFDKDADGAPYSIIGFGNGENRNATRAGLALTNDTATVGGVGADNYHQEAAIQTNVGSETHGGTDVFLGAIGMGASDFHGSIDNTQVFTVVKTAAGL
ncbi:MAG: alkaline phosphatase [Gallionellaceae bacterium]|nr:MAG: alkaline phosphatase [Gallionellaceae bacterium]